MKDKGIPLCQGEACTRDAVATQLIYYRGLPFYLSLCQDHRTELESVEAAERSGTPFQAAEEVLRITRGQETIAQISYAHRCPAITIAFPEEASGEQTTEGGSALVLAPAL